MHQVNKHAKVPIISKYLFNAYISFHAIEYI